MWDIKFVNRIEDAIVGSTFIWTMWDIKEIAQDKQPEMVQNNFHLNHVGYKASSMKRDKADLTTFIWTMWDIKFCDLARVVIVFFFHLNHVGYKVSKLDLFWK